MISPIVPIEIRSSSSSSLLYFLQCARPALNCVQSGAVSPRFFFRHLLPAMPVCKGFPLPLTEVSERFSLLAPSRCQRPGLLQFTLFYENPFRPVPFHLSLFLSGVLDFGAQQRLSIDATVFDGRYSRVFDRTVCKQRRHCGLVFCQLLCLADFLRYFSEPSNSCPCQLQSSFILNSTSRSPDSTAA